MSLLTRLAVTCAVFVVGGTGVLAIYAACACEQNALAACLMFAGGVLVLGCAFSIIAASKESA